MTEITRLEIDIHNQRYDAPARVELHICYGYVIRHFVHCETACGMGYTYDYKAQESVYLNKPISAEKLAFYGWRLLPPERLE